MKKLILALLLTLFTTYAQAGNLSSDAFLISSDVTLAHIEAFRAGVINKINSFPGTNIQAGTIPSSKLDANATPTNRWNEAFNDFVHTGILPGTGTQAAAVITAGTAYISGYRVLKGGTIPGEANYPDTKDIYVFLDKNGVYTYTPVTIGTAQPATPADNIVIAKVTTNTTNVTAVEDKRVTGISLGAGYEDQYITGMELITVSPDVTTVSVDAGVCYNGSYRVSKIVKTTLKFTTASDWWDGSTVDYTSAAGRNIWNYVGVKSDGSVKFLGKNKPIFSDTSGHTTGPLKYWKDTNNVYWRVLGAYPMGNGTVGTANRLRNHFQQRGDWIYHPFTVFYESATTPVMFADTNAIFVDNKTSNSTWTKVVLSTDVPSYANLINIDCWSGGGDFVAFRGANYGGRGLTTNVNYIMSIPGIPIVSQDIYWRMDGASAMNAYISGYSIKDIR